MAGNQRRDENEVLIKAKAIFNDYNERITRNKILARRIDNYSDESEESKKLKKELADNKAYIEEIEIALGALSDIEQRIIRLRFINKVKLKVCTLETTYSDSQCKRITKSALKKIFKILT